MKMLEYQIETLAEAIREAQIHGWPSVSGSLDLPGGRAFITIPISPLSKAAKSARAQELN
jgi:hypothetical protein